MCDEMYDVEVPAEVLLEEAREFAMRALNGEPLPKNYTDPIGRWFNELQASRQEAVA